MNNVATIKPDNDNIYYNFSIFNKEENKDLPAEYREFRGEALLDDPSQYKMTITRFSVPAFNIPILIPKIQKFPNVDINKTIYTLYLTYNGISSDKQTVQYVNFNSYPPPQPPSGLHPEVEYSEYYFIYSIQHFVNMINNTLYNAFIDLAGRTTLPLNAAAPLLIFTPETQLLSFNVHSSYSWNNVSPIFMTFNSPLAELISGFSTRDNLVLDGYDYVIYQNPKNIFTYSTLTYIDYSQEYVTIGSWNVMKAIVFTSSNIPVFHEYLPNLSGSSTNNFNQIVTDFEPVLDIPNSTRSIYQYYPQGPYRLVDLVSEQPLFSLDIKIYWQDKSLNLYPLTIPPLQEATVKVLFIKKGKENSI